MNKYDDFDEFDEIVEREQNRSRRSPFKFVFYLAVMLLLIGGLLWSAVSSVGWLVKFSQTRTAVIDATPTIPAVATNEFISAFPTPDPANRINRIAFVNPDGQVETIAPDGSDQRRISAERFSFQFPAWSPTGEYVAAIGGSGLHRLDDTRDPNVQTLYTSFSQTPFYFYWSPDGRFLSFLTDHPLGIALHLAETTGNSDSRLLETGSPFYWDWAADSSQLLIHTGFAGEEARLALLDRSSGRVGPNVTVPGAFQAPSISRDGRYWAYAELDENGNSWLVTADSQTGEAQRQRHAGLVAFGWSPTANWVAFISAGSDIPDYQGPLRLMDAATGEVRLLSRETTIAFFWSPDGQYVAAITRNEENGEVIAKNNSRRPTLSKPAQQLSSELNLKIIDISSGEIRHLFTFQPTISFVAQFLPFFDQYVLSHRLWSPDGTALALPARNNGVNQIFIVPINGDQPARIANGDMPAWSQQ